MLTDQIQRGVLIGGLALTSLLVIGCHGGGQGMVLPVGNGRTVLVFSDDCGDPLLGRGRLAGLVMREGDEKSSFLLRPGADGSVSLNLLPGTYNVKATWQGDPTKDPLPINQSFTVSNPLGEFVNVGSNDPRLEAGWTKYRVRDFAGAKLVFTQLLDEGVNPGTVQNGLGWANGQLGLIGSSSENFQAAQGAGCTGTDALVGYAGLTLLTPTVANVNQAEGLLTDAIGRGNYHSAPTHDEVTQTDLYVSRALARYLKGDAAGAKADLDIARETIGSDPNFAGQDLFNLLDLQLKN